MAGRSPAQLRRAIRAGEHKGLTSGLAPGFAQGNLAVVPAELADDFVRFCNANPAACPVLGVGRPGDPRIPALGDDLDVRTDLPLYRVYKNNKFEEKRNGIADLWRDDLVAVVIGCWFGVEQPLLEAGIRLRHLELGIQGPLFRSSLPARAAGVFGGSQVVSMRPFARRHADLAAEITARYPKSHGAPLHRGDPEPLGIRDLSQPDFGEPISLEADEIPLYWGCGLTALAALERAGLPFFITHAPGAMLITDLRNESLALR
jgi:uncharacterized protein YcsI (UPF0317 family)